MEGELKIWMKGKGARHSIQKVYMQYKCSNALKASLPLWKCKPCPMAPQSRSIAESSSVLKKSLEKQILDFLQYTEKLESETKIFQEREFYNGLSSGQHY